MLLLSRGLMAKIRQFNIIHYSKVNKLLSAISPGEKLSFGETFLGFFSDVVQNFLPLSLKKSPESFIAINENDEARAFITLEAVSGNRRKWYIKRLFLYKNSFEEGKQLIDYIVAKYGALGADTFCVLIDENDDTSAGLFSKMCGFRLCSREIVWKCNDFNTIDTPYKKDMFDFFRNSDSKSVADFYNDGIAPHFRFSLEKEPHEFNESLFKGFSKVQSFKMVLRDKSAQILAYAEIQSVSKNGWLIDLIVTKPNEDKYLPILKCIINTIKNRSSSSEIYVLNRNYMTCAKTFEEILEAEHFEKTQIKMLLVKDFYKPVRATETIVNPAVIFNEITGKPAFLAPDSLQKSD